MTRKVDDEKGREMHTELHTVLVVHTWMELVSCIVLLLSCSTAAQVLNCRAEQGDLFSIGAARLLQEPNDIGG